MKLILNKMSKYWYLILLIIGVLFVQAFAELKLPDFMAKIVNVGIQQSGVENSLPYVISEDTFKKIKIVSKIEEYERLEKNYKLSNVSEAKEKYPELFKGENIDESIPIYYLSNDTEKNNKDLQKILAQSFMIEQFIEKGAPQGIQKEEADKLPKIPTGDEGFKTISSLPQNVKESMLRKAYESFTKFPDDMLIQSSMKLIGNEYEKIGISQEKMQNRYMFKTATSMVLVAFVSLIASLLVGFIASRIAADFGRSLREEIFTRVLSFSNTEFDKFSTASLITRSNNDIQQVQNMMVMVLRMMFFAPILGIGGIIKAIRTNVSMAWILALSVVLIMGFVLLLFSFAIPMFKEIQKLVDRLQLVTREILNGILVIRAFVTGKHEEERFDVANKDITNLNQKIANVMNLMQPVLMLISNATLLLIVWVGASQIYDARFKVGDLMAFMQYAMQIMMSFLMITMVSIMLPRAQISLRRVNEVLDEEPVIKNKENAVKLPERIDGNIEFKNVSFKFLDAPEYAIENINLEIRKGEVTAIIGSTGSGKSTLINMIPRFYDATEGEVLIDGINVKDIDLKDLRNRIGYVPQKATLFSGTINDNMRIGKNQDISEERISEASNIAQASEFITNFDEGFNHEITQGGSNVSGGQKQRLSIARAIAKKPEIYIFDDSFSALDFKTDLELRRALNVESKDSTVIIVAQRIGTIMNADRIVVMDEGQIVGTGKHEELLKNNGVYRQIASSQLSKEAM